MEQGRRGPCLSGQGVLRSGRGGHFGAHGVADENEAGGQMRSELNSMICSSHQCYPAMVRERSLQLRVTRFTNINMQRHTYTARCGLQNSPSSMQHQVQCTGKWQPRLQDWQRLCTSVASRGLEMLGFLTLRRSTSCAYSMEAGSVLTTMADMCEVRCGAPMDDAGDSCSVRQPKTPNLCLTYSVDIWGARHLTRRSDARHENELSRFGELELTGSSSYSIGSFLWLRRLAPRMY